MLTKEIIDNIQELKDQASETNDAVVATKKVAELVIESVQASFDEFAATNSIDDRMKILVDGSKETVRIVEDYHNELEKKVNDFRLQISTLETLLDRVKKFEEDAGEQTVSIQDEGEKKGDEPSSESE